MKKFLTIIMLCGVIGGYAQNTPPYAASTNTWVIEGNGISQIWSDHINVPACDKADFNGGTDDAPRADCRNNPGYYFLYSWPYVNKNAATLCPVPWRVPTIDDFLALYKALGGKGDWSKDETLVTKYINSWGGAYGGYCNNEGLPVNQNLYADYWSSSEFSSTSSYYFGYTDSSVYPQYYYNKYHGFLIRCMK
ncbi:MAG: fibrobacter succinogenes major paralogous domain-containing protein [Prevotellaceae bacterium]|jgi:uncharacterized protein (TIGR02145 family)|nr:fibrobacter succinogenes major paralogous domain-containing protein [Prevotellaceae bacterium]